MLPKYVSFRPFSLWNVHEPHTTVLLVKNVSGIVNKIHRYQRLRLLEFHTTIKSRPSPPTQEINYFQHGGINC